MNAFANLQYVFAVSIAADIPMRSAEVSQPLRVLSLHQLQMEVHSEMELRRECFVVFLVRRAFLVWCFGFVCLKEVFGKAPRIGSI